jgi:hypothetical protein
MAGQSPPFFCSTRASTTVTQSRHVQTDICKSRADGENVKPVGTNRRGAVGYHHGATVVASLKKRSDRKGHPIS